MTRLSSPNFIETADTSISFATSYAIDLNQSAQGTIGTSSDVDYYRIQLVQGQTYTFALIGTGLDFLSDPILKLRNASGTLLTSNDDSGVGYSALLTYRANQSGTYYLDVSNVDSSTGQYGLSISSGSKASFDLPMAGALSLRDQPHWNPHQSHLSLTPEAITMALMQRYWMASYVDQKIRRELLRSL